MSTELTTKLTTEPTGLIGQPELMTGPTGSIGNPGPTGSIGNPGPTGSIGNPGQTGLIGLTIPIGLLGKNEDPDEHTIWPIVKPNNTINDITIDLWKYGPVVIIFCEGNGKTIRLPVARKTGNYVIQIICKVITHIKTTSKDDYISIRTDETVITKDELWIRGTFTIESDGENHWYPLDPNCFITEVNTCQPKNFVPT